MNVGSKVRSTSAGDLYRVNAERTRLLFWLARNASRLAPVACAAMLISALEAATVPGNRLWQSFAIRASSASRCAPAASVIRPRLMPYMPAFQVTIVCTRECPGHSSLSMPHAQSVTHPCPGAEQRVRANPENCTSREKCARPVRKVAATPVGITREPKGCNRMHEQTRNFRSSHLTTR